MLRSEVRGFDSPRKANSCSGGLGGGSSNAAITLLGLARLWQLPAQPRYLVKLAAELGADVPFFLEGGSTLATGIGAFVKPLRDVATQHLLIVAPVATVSTAEAYKALNAPALTTSDSNSILAIRTRG